MFYAQCGHTTCGSDLWLPDMSEGECGAGQGCRVQDQGAGQECSGPGVQGAGGVQWWRVQDQGPGCRAGVQSADFQSVVLTSTLAQAATIYSGHEGNQPDIT